MCQQFAVSEFRAGRWPIWTPNNFCGTPFIYSEYSPFKIPYVLFHVAAGFRVAAVLSGDIHRAGGVFLLPPRLAGRTVAGDDRGVVLAADRLLRFLDGIQPDVLGRLASVASVDRRRGRAAEEPLGRALACPGDVPDDRQRAVRRRRASAVGVGALCRLVFHRRVRPAVLHAAGLAGAGDDRGGLGLGTRSGLRLSAAAAGVLAIELPRWSGGAAGKRSGRRSGWKPCRRSCLPDMYGSTQEGYLPVPPRMRRNSLEGNQLESSAAAYAGLLATLLLMPLAWCSRRHRSINVFWTALAVLGVSWCLDLPVFVHLLRLPGLNMLSHNRFVFATSFAIVAMMAVGLDVLWRGEVRWRWWFWGPVAVLAILLLWCGYRSVVLPDEIAGQIVPGTSHPQRLSGAGDSRYGGGGPHPIDLSPLLLGGHRAVRSGLRRLVASSGCAGRRGDGSCRCWAALLLADLSGSPMAAPRSAIRPVLSANSRARTGGQSRTGPNHRIAVPAGDARTIAQPPRRPRIRRRGPDAHRRPAADCRRSAMPSVRSMRPRNGSRRGCGIASLRQFGCARSWTCSMSAM